MKSQAPIGRNNRPTPARPIVPPFQGFRPSMNRPPQGYRPGLTWVAPAGLQQNAAGGRRACHAADEVVAMVVLCAIYYNVAIAGNAIPPPHTADSAGRGAATGGLSLAPRIRSSSHSDRATGGNRRSGHDSG